MTHCNRMTRQLRRLDFDCILKHVPGTERKRKKKERKKNKGEEEKKEGERKRKERKRKSEV